MERNKMADAGNTDGTFYQTNMQPANWYTWFSKEGAKDDDGWTQVWNFKYKCTRDRFLHYIDKYFTRK